MTANTMPANHDVHAMLAQMRAEAGDGGPEPSALALAPRLEMANTTFRRNYPAVLAELTRPGPGRRAGWRPDLALADLHVNGVDEYHGITLGRAGGFAIQPFLPSPGR